MNAVRLIAVVGAECTGKTELCQALAKTLDGLWVAEYLREFCDAKGRTPSAVEQIHILLTQQAREAQAVAQAGKKNKHWVLCDSAPIDTALYSQLLFADHGLMRAALAHHTRYGATLHCAPDIEWQADGVQRDGVAARAQFDDALTILLAEQEIAVHRITGLGELRLQSALSALRTLQPQATLGVPQNPEAAQAALGDMAQAT